MTAGDDAIQLHTDTGTINYGTNITVTDVLEIGKSAARTVMLESWPFAEKIIDQRIELILNRIIDRMREKDEALLNRFKDPRFLAALVSVEKSFAETGDEELGEILSGLLADLASKSIRSRREIVLRQAVECAPRLTTKHLNALSVIFRISRIRYPYASTASELIAAIDNDLSPYYDAVPKDAFDYEYIGATEAGTYLRMTQSPVSERIYTAHRNALYKPFVINDFVSEVNQGIAIEEIESRMNDVVSVIRLVPEDPEQRLKLEPEASDRILSVDSAVISTLKPGEQSLREFLRGRSLTQAEFGAAIREEQPNLADFLEHLGLTGAFNLQLSPVGLMLARHEMVSRAPETATQLDTLFDD